MSDVVYTREIPSRDEQSRSSADKWRDAVHSNPRTDYVVYGLKKSAAAKLRAKSRTSQGKWIAADCWADCGSKGYNKAYVVDGVVTRMGTDDLIPDSWETPQLRACARGLALRMWLLGADRLKYPMRRKHWAPGGGRKDLRGRDEGGGIVVGGEGLLIFGGGK